MKINSIDISDIRIGSTAISKVYKDGAIYWLASVLLTITKVGNGTIDPDVGEHSYGIDTAVSITAAESDSNYYFDKFTEDSVDKTNNPLTVTMAANKVVNALFLEYQIESILLFERMAVISENPSTIRKKIIDTLLVKPLLDAGIWAKLDCLWSTASHGIGSYKLNFIKNDHNLTPYGGYTIALNSGIKGNGIDSYLATDFIPSDSNQNYLQNTSSIGIYQKEANKLGSLNGIGTNGASIIGISYIAPIAASSARLNGGNSVNFTSTNSQGLFIVNRKNSTTIELWKNTTKSSGASTSNGLSAYEFYLLARNNAGTIINPDKNTIGLAFIGGVLTDDDILLLNTIISDYIDAISQDKYYSNPATKQEIIMPTYIVDNNEVVHPSVVNCGVAWNGYKYWMAITPYANTNDNYENPSIYASNDGVEWITPFGLTNPVVPFPGGTYYNADTNLFFENGKLYLTWVEVVDSININMIESNDGITWTNKTTITTQDVDAIYNSIPSIIKVDGVYYLYYYANTNPVIIRRKSSITINGQYTDPVNVHFVIPDLDIYHFTVRTYNEKIYLIANSTTINSKTYGNSIYMGESTDGIHFSVDKNPLIIATEVIENKFYKPDFEIIEGNPRLYYTFLDAELKWRLMTAELTIDN